MTQKHEPFQSRKEQEKKIKVLEKFSKGDYGVGAQPILPEGFLEEGIIKEGLQDIYINNSKNQ